MDDGAGEQIGHRGKTDMRVGPHVDARAGRELGRSHLVEENERTDAVALSRRQHAANFKSANVAGTRHDDGLQRLTGRRRRCLRLISRLPTHRFLVYSGSALSRYMA